MRRLSVYVEKNGRQVRIGSIDGESPQDAFFSYADEYLNSPEPRPISVSLPLEEKCFCPVRTRNFFDGLLPEGFTRRCVAEYMKVGESDYLSILAGLGRECLGAVMIREETAEEGLESAYRKLSSEEVRALAEEGAAESAQIVVESHLSLTGASGKVGLYFDKANNQWYQPIGTAPSTHIVKQSHIRLQNIVANEQLCLLTAQKLGIDTPESFVVRTGGTSECDVLFATRRYDRMYGTEPEYLNGLPIPYRLHQEDFAQAMGISALNKYEHGHEGYLRQMFSLLRTYSARPVEDQLKLWDMSVFNYLIGNTDAHIKNFSLIYGRDLKTIRLAPAYDIVSTVVYDRSSSNMAFSIGGCYRINEIDRKSFEAEAVNVGLGKKAAMKSFDRLVSGFEKAISEAADMLAKQGFETALSIKDSILKKAGIGLV